MKQILFFLAVGGILTFSGMAIGQPIKVVKQEDKNLVFLLNHVTSFKQVFGKQLGVTVYTINNPIETGHIGESDEVSQNIYLAVSEVGEGPSQSLFVIKNLVNVSNILFEKSDKGTIWISFTHTDMTQKTFKVKKEVCKITLKDVSVG
jgi:hypothetical protein